MSTELTESDISSDWTIVSSESNGEDKNDAKEEEKESIEQDNESVAEEHVEIKVVVKEEDNSNQNKNDEITKSTNDASQNVMPEEILFEGHEQYPGSETSSDIDVIDENLDESFGTLSLPASDLVISSVGEILAYQPETSEMPVYQPEISIKNEKAILSIERIEPVIINDAIKNEEVETLVKEIEPVDVIIRKVEPAIKNDLTKNEEYKSLYERVESVMEPREYVEDDITVLECYSNEPLWKELLMKFFMCTNWKMILFCTTIAIFGIYAMYMQKDYNDKLLEIKQEFLDLQHKTKNVRETLVSEYETEKALNTAFQKQVKELKEDNLKLKHILQEYANLLQEKTRSLSTECQSRESETKMHYNDEINKLKEQINMLQFDNEELQKQLVRIRYGNYITSVHSPEDNTKSTKQEIKNEKETSKPDEKIFTASEKLTDELKQLNRDLHSEIDKLKKWNELFEEFSKETQKTKSDKKSSWDELKKGIKDIISHAQNDVADTINNFPNINISEMLTKYMDTNKKHAENMLNSISHYFKVAHEKTKKILNADEVKKEWKTAQKNIWGTFEDLSKKWTKIKREFYKVTDNDKNAHPHDETNDEDKKETANSYFSNPHFYDETQNNLDNQENKFSNLKDEKTYHHSESNWNFKPKSTMDKETPKEEANSWMFQRAAHREQLRQDEKEDASTNWYFKRRQEDKEIDGSYKDKVYHDDDSLNYGKKKSDKWKMHY